MTGRLAGKRILATQAAAFMGPALCATLAPPEVQGDARFAERLRRDVPLGRLVCAEEDAQFAADLCSDAANCFLGQVFPVCGRWAVR